MEIESITYKGESISLHFDNGEKVVVPLSLAHAKEYFQGKVIDQKEYLSLKEKSEFFVCKQKVLQYLARSIKSTLEVRRYLATKQCSEENSNKIVRFLEDAGYLDDYQYGIEFVTSLQRRNKIVGTRYIQHKLFQKGLSKDIIRRVMEKNTPDEENIDAVYALAEKKYLSLQGKKNCLAKVAYFLQARGFADAIVYKVIEQLQASGISSDHD